MGTRQLRVAREAVAQWRLKAADGRAGMTGRVCVYKRTGTTPAVLRQGPAVTAKARREEGRHGAWEVYCGYKAVTASRRVGVADARVAVATRETPPASTRRPIATGCIPFPVQRRQEHKYGSSRRLLTRMGWGRPPDPATSTHMHEEENQRRDASCRRRCLPATRTPRLLLSTSGGLPKRLFMRAFAATCRWPSATRARPRRNAGMPASH